jgi:enoyl-CoA hydratase/carnithine racemase
MANRAQLSRLLAHRIVHVLPESKVRKHFDTINAWMAGDSLPAIAARLADAHGDDAWLTTAAATFVKGSPTSAALAFALWQRVLHLSLADVFRLEYNVSLGCCAHHDFAEGIRALLIDKDRTPRWSPASLDDVTPALIDAHFQPRFAGPHPLAELERSPS